jgi:WD40 repeat protein
MLATAGDDGSAVVWDVTDRSTPHRLGEPLIARGGTLYSVAFSPDSRTLVTGGEANPASWDLTDRRQPRPFGAAQTEDLAVAVAISPDGATLATAGQQTVQLWDLTYLNARRDGVIAAACGMAGRGLSEGEWRALLPDIPYVDTCPAA